MKLKLDENLNRRLADLFNSAGFYTTTVHDENLCSTPDEQLLEVCRKEEKCLLTLDMGFANTLKFRPQDYHGIIVMRIKGNLSMEKVFEVAKTVIEALGRESIRGKLWVAGKNRIRVHRNYEIETE